MTVAMPKEQFGAPASKPRAGRSLAASVAPLGRLVLAAVEILSHTAPIVPLAWIAVGSGRDRETGSEDLRKAWAIAAVGLINGIATGKSVRLAAGLRWFGDFDSASALDTIDLHEVEALLSAVASNPSAEELLPYILDGFGATSRLDVIRDGTRRADRAARKEAGSFYTPSDVADFMVESIAGPRPDEAVWLDPACGSGVFLLAVLRCLEKRGVSSAVVAKFATTNLCGLDISPLATDFAAFTLVCHIAEASQGPLTEVWAQLRTNLVAVNALEVTARAKAAQGTLSIRDLFATVDGSLKIVCNPPYAPSGEFRARKHWSSLQNGSASTSLCLPFVEMAWKFDGCAGDAAAFVVPLSVTTNRSNDHAALREALAKAGGDWTLLFFDRQPHALFGEDAKTRNVIMIRRQAEEFRAKTSRMLKWTSKQRASIFTEDRAVSLGAAPIRRLVPKLGCQAEVEFYTRLTAYNLRSGDRPALTSIAPLDIAEAATDRDVFVGGTAYNFLNVFRSYPSHQAAGGVFSASKVHRLTFATSALAKAGFAILSSRVAFWLWHAECDGFHVPAWFLEDLPLFDLTLPTENLALLPDLGDALWESAKANIIASLNGGKRTFSFRPGAGVTRSLADDLIRSAVGDNGGHFGDALAFFEEATTKVDGTFRASRAGSLEEKMFRMMSQ